MPTIMPTLSVSSDQVEQSSTPSKKKYKVCTVPFCSLNEDRFASLPSVKEFERRNKWFELLQLDRKIKLHRICHGHFDRHDFGPFKASSDKKYSGIPGNPNLETNGVGMERSSRTINCQARTMT